LITPASPLGRKQAHCGVKTGVWLRAKELTEISTALWALRLGKDFAFYVFSRVVIICDCTVMRWLLVGPIVVSTSG